MTTRAGARTSAGLLVFRRVPDPELLIGHMGGPFWARKDDRAWSVPKGELEADEDPLAAALREFREETGLVPPPPPYADLGTEEQRSGKVVHLYAVQADLDLAAFRPGTFTMTRRGRPFEVPEIDRVVYASVDDASRLLVAGQVPFLERLQALVEAARDPFPGRRGPCLVAPQERSTSIRVM